jgi:hypothetical protein
MTDEPDTVDFSLVAVIDGLTWLDLAGKQRVAEFVVHACPGSGWGATELATILVAGLGLLREDPNDPFACALLHVAEETGRQMLAAVA